MFKSNYGNETFKCEYCISSFHYEEPLKEHVKKYHPHTTTGVEYRKPPMSSNMSATYAPSRPSNFEDNSYRSNYG